eukprot:5626182-Amphidinium_carterae.1
MIPCAGFHMTGTLRPRLLMPNLLAANLCSPALLPSALDAPSGVLHPSEATLATASPAPPH